MKYLSTFTGIGGFELAIHNNFKNAECVGFSEIDKFAIQTYLKNFPGHEGKNLGDIERLVFDLDKKGNFVVNEARVRLLPDFDLLVGGSPCQDLSIAKAKRKGLDGLKSRLFFAFLEILRIKKPKYFILENVASMSKDAKEKITNEISKAYGKEVQPMRINAELVSAQKRDRLFWFPWEVEQLEDRGILLKRNGILAHSWSKSVRKNGSFDERIRADGKTNALTCSSTGTESIVFFPEKEINFKPRKVWSRSELYYHEIKNEQKLTIEEMESLQCFPKGWTSGVSTFQATKQLGNAVNVEVINHILSGLKNG